ncbi:phosphomethylpyrimidine synthase ThiC [Pseudomonas aeruginosa]|nr:phosphomethylpyrimidine synthase ThiC [Pseudomonas aeruginosa]
MSATQKNNITRLEQLDRQSTQPFPNSRKVYLTGSRPDIRVPVREISLADTPTAFGGEKKPAGVSSTTPPARIPTLRSASTCARACLTCVRAGSTSAATPRSSPA